MKEAVLEAGSTGGKLRFTLKKTQIHDSCLEIINQDITTQNQWEIHDAKYFDKLMADSFFPK